MKKFIFLCVAVSLSLGGVANTTGAWLGVKINGKSLECQGEKIYYSSSGGGMDYAWDDTMALCLKDKNTAHWVAMNDDGVGFYGENCEFKAGSGWDCESKHPKAGEISVEMAEDFEFFDEDEIFPTGRFSVVK